MKFGKLQDINGVDFSLPESSPANQTVLKKLSAKSKAPGLFVGCTGWSMKEWIGKVYPKGTKTKDYLKYYSQQFNTIEFNTTHYRIPAVNTISKWYQDSTDDFQFCPKIPQVISHSKDLAFGNGNTLAFCEAIQGLQEKLGHSFLQLPPYFGRDRLGLLKTFIENFPNHIPLSIEFRHESWFDETDAFDEIAKIMEQHNIATVITDVAGRRDVLHQRLTSDTVVIRFVGNDLHPTDFQRIDSWIDQLASWYKQGLKTVYFFTHEPDNLLAPEMADYLVRKAKQNLQVETRGPDLQKYKDGDQMSLF